MTRKLGIQFDKIPYKELSNRLSVPDGGYTYDPRRLRHAPLKGYMVSQYGTEHVVEGQASPKDIREYVERYAYELDNPRAYLGGWRDPEGPSYLDISHTYQSRDQALRQGLYNAQLAIYDAEAEQSIPVDYSELSHEEVKSAVRGPMALERSRAGRMRAERQLKS